MKRIYVFIGYCIFAYLFSACEESSTIQVQNNISAVRITDVKWGNVFLSRELLPGESSSKISINLLQEDIPKTAPITFKMVAKQNTVYLETEEEFTLKADDELLIILSDDTKVKNPNN